MRSRRSDVLETVHMLSLCGRVLRDVCLAPCGAGVFMSRFFLPRCNGTQLLCFSLSWGQQNKLVITKSRYNRARCKRRVAP